MSQDDDTVFDLDAARARRLETTGRPMRFTFAGETFSMPAPSEWPLDSTETLAKGELNEFFRDCLGVEQYDRLLACDPKPTMGDLQSLISQVSTDTTGGPGN